MPGQNVVVDGFGQGPFAIDGQPLQRGNDRWPDFAEGLDIAGSEQFFDLRVAHGRLRLRAALAHYPTPGRRAVHFAEPVLIPQPQLGEGRNPSRRRCVAGESAAGGPTRDKLLGSQLATR